MARRKHYDPPAVEAKKVYCTCDEITSTIFDESSRIECSVHLWPKTLCGTLSGGVLVEFVAQASHEGDGGVVTFYMSFSAAALLGRKLIAASKQEVI